MPIGKNATNSARCLYSSCRTNDSIFEELVETGIILPTRAVRQKDYIGDYQYLSETLRQNEKEPMPSLLDCQQLVTLQIVFPLCKSNIRRSIRIEFFTFSRWSQVQKMYISTFHLIGRCYSPDLEVVAKNYSFISHVTSSVVFFSISRRAIWSTHSIPVKHRLFTSLSSLLTSGDQSTHAWKDLFVSEVRHLHRSFLMLERRLCHQRRADFCSHFPWWATENITLRRNCAVLQLLLIDAKASNDNNACSLNDS